MPETTITIDRDQRDGIYELVRNHLGSIEDFWVALERTKDFVKAEELGAEFAEDFRLLEDIGWSVGDERDEFELSMPPYDLVELLARLRREAVEVLSESDPEPRASREGVGATIRFQVGRETCDKVIADLDPREAG